MTNLFQKIGVIGAGAWGTALAQLASLTGRDVLLYAREAELVAQLNTHHTNPTYLPNIALNSAINATNILSDLAACDAVLLVTPAQYCAAVCESLKAIITNKPIVICAKGIDLASGQLLSTVVAHHLPQSPVAVLSGPAFALEAAKGLPTAVTLAAPDLALAKKLCASLGSKTFRPYASTDKIGAQLGGSLKNVLAIGCGMVMGKGLGENARAALMARGLAEMQRLNKALGGQPETLMGLSGIGDLVLTCSSQQSRNMSLGYELGQGKPLQAILANRHSVAEGVATAKAAMQLAKQHGVAMPICEAINHVLHEGKEINTAIAELLERPITIEGNP